MIYLFEISFLCKNKKMGDRICFKLNYWMCFFLYKISLIIGNSLIVSLIIR